MKIISPHIACAVNLPLSADDPDELQTAMDQNFVEIYIVTPTGIIKHHKLRGENRYLRLKVDSIPGVVLPSVPEAVNFLPAGKIPHQFFTQIEAFFRKVSAVKKTDLEAMIWIMWNAERGYFLHVPDQTVGKASASYNWADVPNNSSIIVDIHSHNSMPAFYSSTDNADDSNGIRFSGVFGKLDQPEPMTVWRFNYREKKYESKVTDIFENPAKPEVEVPEAWLAQVKTQTIPTYTRQPYQRPEAHGFGRDRSLNPAGNTYGYGDGYSAGEYDMYENYGKGGAKNGKPFRPSASKPGEVVINPKEYMPTFGGNKVTGKKTGAHATLGVEQLGFNPDDWGLDPVGGNEGDLIADGFPETNFDSLDAAGDVVDRIYASQINPRFDELAINHGPKVATAFCAINEIMADLSDDDELVEELVEELSVMIVGEKRVKLLGRIFETLPRRERDKIETNGF